MLTARRRRTAQGRVGLATLCFAVYEVLVVFDTFNGRLRRQLILPLSALRASLPASAGREHQIAINRLKSRKFPDLCRIDSLDGIRRESERR